MSELSVKQSGARAANYTLFHISDLHIGAAPSSAINTLAAAIIERAKKLDHLGILVVTGDLVDRPKRSFLLEAKKLLERLAIEGGIRDQVVIRGNHDAKWFGGSFVRTDAFKKMQIGPSEVKLPGIQILGLDSNGGGPFARGRIPQTSYDFLAKRADPEDDVVRVVAVHHHPVPLVRGDGFKEGRILDEPYMYLESPGIFLDACIYRSISLVLHGHRHVTGMARYSSLRNGAWRDLYVLSCPSSTQISGDTAGFNVIRVSNGTLQITRLQRQHQRPFEPVDSGGISIDAVGCPQRLS